MEERAHAQVQGEVQMQEQEKVQAEMEVTVAEGEVVVAAGVGVAVVVGEVAAIEVAAAEEFVRDDAVVLAAGVEYMPMDTSIPSSRRIHPRLPIAIIGCWRRAGIIQHLRGQWPMLIRRWYILRILPVAGGWEAHPEMHCS